MAERCIDQIYLSSEELLKLKKNLKKKTVDYRIAKMLSQN